MTIGPRDGGGFGLAVKLLVKDKTLPQRELASPAKEAHEKICPYSHATRGNVPVEPSKGRGALARRRANDCSRVSAPAMLNGSHGAR